jgi:type I restriction enzyme S subunit
MTLDTFFKKFDQFADAPDAVAKMRGLVLELAVQGKLVEPPSKPETDRAWLAFKKEISERIYGYDPGSTPPFDIPEHWEWSVLGEVAKPCGQKTPDENFTYIDVGSIDNARGELKPDLNTIEPAHAPSRARKLAKLGSVIYATVRPYLKNIAVIEKEFCPPAIISTAFAILHPLPFVESRFLFYWLRSSAFEREVSAYAKGVAYPAISDGDLKGCVIPVPPPSEQKRIVAKVDELMALCDRLEAQQQERDEQASALARASLARFAEAPTPANLNLLFHKSYSISPADLRKSILTLAIQGKLVPQDPNDEPAAVLLARILRRDAQANGRRRKSQPDLAFTSDEMPFELPSGWAWERLGNIGETNIGLTYSPQDVSDVGIPVLRSSNVQNSKLDFCDLVRVRCEPKLSAMVQDGDLLLCARNGSRALVGKVAVIEGLNEPAAFGAFMTIFRSEVNQYLYHFIRAPLFRQMIDEVNTTTINQITQGNLRSTLAPIPPLAEQHRIVAKVDQLMALVDQLETQLAGSRATAKNLLEAFVSELSSDLIM